MNEDTCPCCERSFSIMFEYSLVRLLSVNKIKLPRKLRFHFNDKTNFIPFSENIENRLPDEVANFFGEARGIKRSLEETELFLQKKGIDYRTNQFEYEGNVWRPTGFTKCEGNKGISTYRRVIPDNKPEALPYLISYLDSLEKMVGREIAPTVLLPVFEVDTVFELAYLTNDALKYKNRYRIPRCDLLLNFGEGEKKPDGTRCTELCILDDCRGDIVDLSGGWGGPLKQVVAVCAELGYKGLLKSH